MKTLYMILGMHRSGTSLTAQVMHNMNVWVGQKEQLLSENEYNEKGYWELRDLVYVDEMLLTESNSTWYSLETPVLDSELTNKLVSNFVEEYLNNDKEKIAIKDPRLSVIWKAWIDGMNYDKREIQGVIVVRNPFEVAESLHRRNQMQKDYALCLWYHYNWQSLLFATQYPSLWMAHADYFEHPEMLKERLWKFVYKNSDEKTIELNDIVDTGIRHHKQEEKLLETWIENQALQFYNALLSLSRDHISAQEIVNKFSDDYESTMQYGKKLMYVEKDVKTKEDKYLRAMGLRPEKYWIHNLQRWLGLHSQPIVLCGNGRNTEKVIPLLERCGADVVGIFDNHNFIPHNYKRDIITIWSFAELAEKYRSDILYLITPFWGSAEELYLQLVDKIPTKQLFMLRELLLKEDT